MRERLRNWSLSVCTACSVCICAVFIAWRGNVFMRRKRKTELLCKRWGIMCRGIVAPGYSPSMYKVLTRLLQQLITSVTHWLSTSSFRNCWGFLKAKECVAPLLPPIFTYVHSFTRLFYKKASPSWEVQPGRRTEFQHRDREWKHASAPDQLTGPESSVKAKEFTLFSFAESTHLASAGSKGEDEKIKHTFIISHSLFVSACFCFFCSFFHFVSDSLYCFVSLHVAPVCFFYFS